MIEYRLLLWVLDKTSNFTPTSSDSSSASPRWRLTNAPGLPQSPDCNVPNINAPAYYDELLTELTGMLAQEEYKSEGWRYRTCYTRKSDLTGENSEYIRVIIERGQKGSPGSGLHSVSVEEARYCHKCGAALPKVTRLPTIPTKATEASSSSGTDATGRNQPNGASGQEDPPAYFGSNG